MTLEIRTIEDGEVITENGAYRVSMSWYHSQGICDGPSISSTGLRKLALQSPHAFWKTSDWNKDRYPEKDIGDALILGRAAHAIILGDEVFDDHFIYVPHDAPPRPTKTQIAAFERDGKWSDSAAPRAEFWKTFDAKAAGRLLLTEGQVEKIMYMADNIADTPEAVEVLTSELTEISLIWKDEATGIWIKSRPDCLPTNGVDFGDLKTFSPKGADLILSAMRAVTDHGYVLQMALASMGAEIVLGGAADNCALVFVQTTEPYEVIPISLDVDAMYWGKVLCRHGLDLAAHGLKTGEWPGRAKGFVEYNYPPSLLHRFGEMQANGEIPNINKETI